MTRSKEKYILKVHYPEDKEDELELRRRMGKAYMRFLEDYIMTLPINDEEKNKLYFNINSRLYEKYKYAPILPPVNNTAEEEQK